MNYYFLTLLLILSCLSYAYDSSVELYIEINDKETERKLEGSYAEVYKNGKLIQTFQMPLDKKTIIISLPVNHVYQVFVKKEGYITKMTQIDATHPNQDELDSVIPQKMEITLFKLIPNIDFSFLETEPMAKFKISMKGPFMEMDVKYTNDMKVKIEKLLKSKIYYAKQRVAIPEMNADVETFDTNNQNQFSEKPKEKLNDEVGAPIQTKKKR